MHAFPYMTLAVLVLCTHKLNLGQLNLVNLVFIKNDF